MTQLDRIEGKLDTLLELMAAILDNEEEQESPQQDLDGNTYEKPESYGGTL